MVAGKESGDTAMKIRVSQALGAAALAALFLLLPAAAPQAAEGKLEKTAVKLGLSVPTASHLPLYIAKEKGFFMDEGLDAELVVFRAAPELLAVYLAGGVDFCFSSVTEVFTAREVGRDMKMFWMVSDAMPYELWANPKFPTLQSAKGARFAVSKYGAFSDFITRWTIHEAGLNPDKDVQILQVGGPGERLAALTRGAVDVAILEPAEGLEAKKAGMVLQTRIYDYLKEFPAEPLALLVSWVDKNPEVTKAVIRALRRAIVYAKDNRADAIKIYKDTFRYSEEAADLAYDFYLTHFPMDGAVPRRGLEVAVEDAVAAKRIRKPYTFDDLVDTRFMHEIGGMK
jgi:NitT/TauT family transport system substrate-binding protein